MLIEILVLAAGVASPLELIPRIVVADSACIVMSEDPPLAERPSPLDSTVFEIGGGVVKVCYGRPSVRGREIIGKSQVPYGRLWRTGANEPTMIHTSVALVVAGIEIEPGIYSFYTIPGEHEWEVILNRSITQWGHRNRYTDEVRVHEVGRGVAPAERIEAPVEMLTFRPEATEGDTVLVLEWEHTRVSIPLSTR